MKPRRRLASRRPARAWLLAGLLALAGLTTRAAETPPTESARAARPTKPFPAHWGEPPRIQTMDFGPLPGGYGYGSSTLARWIEANLKKDQAARPRRPDGPGTVTVSGQLKQWHKVTLTLDGPFAHERDVDPNPFTDYRLTVVFTHESGTPSYRVPGYFAADGNAAETSAESGTRWRAHLAPDQPGRWTYALTLQRGRWAAVDVEAAARAPTVLAARGEFSIGPTDKQGRDFRAHGRLEYVGRHHLRFAGSGEYFLKVGADAPENLLAYADFDGTVANPRTRARPGENAPAGRLKTWAPHRRDWRPGDPTWQGGKGQGLIGALNYLASRGANAFSFLPYNAGGDGDEVWPFVERDAKLHYDCSKLDQWGVVFDHATTLGLFLHFKLQEQEMDDHRVGHDRRAGFVPEALDGGRLGPERKLYLRELVARFGHLLALNWNLGEENTQSTEEQIAMAQFLDDTDPYRHPIVLHTFPDQQDRVYPPLLGGRSALTGVSLQNSWRVAHQRTLHWVRESARAGKPWVVCHDEQNPADYGVPPDPGYAGHPGEGLEQGRPYTLHDIRKYALWGNLLAGGGGVEYYFGYRLPQNDLQCEDWRSRERSWDYGRVALEFFHAHRLPFWEMTNANALVGNATNDNSRYCLARRGEVYVVYLPEGGTATLDLGETRASFEVHWYNPRAGGPLQRGKVERVTGPGPVALGAPPAEPHEDWVVLVRR